MKPESKPEEHDPWRRHPVLAALGRRWPGLGSASPPDRTRLQEWVAAAGLPLSLVDNAGDRSYERAVAEGLVPTRPGSWHDVFNVLSFVRFPRAKAALHRRVLELQDQRQRQGGITRRTREEDALTLLDEAVLVVGGAAVSEFELARRSGDFEAIQDLVRGGGLRIECFGHALLEHLVLGRPRIGAGILSLADIGDSMDGALAQHIESGSLREPRFAPTLDWPDVRIEAWLARSMASDGSRTV